MPTERCTASAISTASIRGSKPCSRHESKPIVGIARQKSGQNIDARHLFVTIALYASDHADLQSVN
jgi:hypothetical protein